MDGILPDWAASTSDLPSPQEMQTQQAQQQQNIMHHVQQPQDQQQHQQYQPPPTQQPQPPPPPGAQNGPSASTYRPRKKLRESCNNCALSKVKCTKEHPQCQRCEDREMYCHYSPTRRTGKRRAMSQTAPNNNANPSANSNPNSNSNSSGVPPMQIKELTPTPPAETGYFDYSSLVLNHGMSMNQAVFSGLSTQMLRIPDSATMNMKPAGMIRDFSGDMFPESLDPGLFSELDQLGISLSPVAEGHRDIDITMGDYDNGHQDLIFSLMSPANEGSSGFAAGTGTGTTTNHGNHSSGSSSDGLMLGDYGSQHCIGRALEILAKLHNTPVNCTLSTSIPPSGSARDVSSSATPTMTTADGTLPTPISAHTPLTVTSGTSSVTTRTIDQVMATNKETVKAVHRILDCPCSLNLQTALILTTIVSKVLCWYGAVGRAQSENPEGFARPSSPSLEPSAGRGSSNMSMSLNLSPTPTSTRTSTPAPGGGIATPVECVSLTAPYTFFNKYTLDNVQGRDASRVSAQVVLGELHLVLRLVKKLVARFRRIEGGGKGTASNDDGDPSNTAAETGRNASQNKPKVGTCEGINSAGMPVLVEMERFLLDQLKELARETTNMLRSS